MAFLISSMGAFLFANTGTYLFYLVSLFLIGTGMAMLQVAINPLLRTIGGEKEFAFNSVLAQMFFGLASFISPLVYSYIINNVNDQAESGNLIINLLNTLKIPEMEWISLYWIFAIISFIMVVIISLIKLPFVEKTSIVFINCRRSYRIEINIYTTYTLALTMLVTVYNLFG